MDDNSSLVVMGLVAVCCFCAIQILVIGMIVMIFRNRRKAENIWKNFAAKHGFTHQSPDILERGPGTMSGQFDGRHVVIESYHTGGRHAVMWTEAFVPINNPKGLILAVGAKGFDGTLYKAFGAQDITIGINDFDDKYTIQSNPPELASKILQSNAELRAEIDALSPYELKYKDKGASCRLMGFQLDEAVLLNMLRLARKFADVVENSG
ncbi:MAG: hypothetical protein HYZ21_06450 [Chloroflexi bacterium]|nr:hypothetical protein [Chloroflexota bacterium]